MFRKSKIINIINDVGPITYESVENHYICFLSPVWFKSLTSDYKTFLILRYYDPAWFEACSMTSLKYKI